MVWPHWHWELYLMPPDCSACSCETVCVRTYVAHKSKGTKTVPDNSRQGKPVSQDVGKVAHGPHNHRLQDCTVKEGEEGKRTAQATRMNSRRCSQSWIDVFINVLAGNRERQIHYSMSTQLSSNLSCSEAKHALNITFPYNHAKYVPYTDQCSYACTYVRTYMYTLGNRSVQYR